MISGKLDWQDAEAELMRAAVVGIEQYVRKYYFALIVPFSLRLADAATGDAITVNQSNFEQLGEERFGYLLSSVYRGELIN